MEREKEWGCKWDYELVVQEELTSHILDTILGETVADLKRIGGLQ